MRKYRLVVIDDHYDILELLQYNLTREEYEVKNFVNAVDALKYITRENTDMVITDWMLPEMDGLDLCKNLKHSLATPDIPVVMITRKSDEIDVVTALEVGAEDYIVKPFRIKEMLSRIKKILRRNSMEIDNAASREKRVLIIKGGVKIDVAGYKIYLNEEIL